MAKRLLTIHEKNINFTLYEDFLDKVKDVAIREFNKIVKKQKATYSRVVKRILKSKKAISVKISKIDNVKIRFQKDISKLIEEYLTVIALFGLREVSKELKIKNPKKLSQAIKNWIKSVSHTATNKYIADVNSFLTHPVIEGILENITIDETVEQINSIFDKEAVKKSKQIFNFYEGAALFRGRDLGTQIFNGNIKLELSFQLLAVRDFFVEEKVVAAQWSAVLDSHTCELCNHLDGRIVDVRDGDYGLYHPGDVHASCRCLWVYIKNTERPENRQVTGLLPKPEVVREFAKEGEQISKIISDKYAGKDISEIKSEVLKKWWGTGAPNLQRRRLMAQTYEFFEESRVKAYLLKEKFLNQIASVKVVEAGTLGKGVAANCDVWGNIKLTVGSRTGTIVHEIGHSLTTNFKHGFYTEAGLNKKVIDAYKGAINRMVVDMQRRGTGEKIVDTLTAFLDQKKLDRKISWLGVSSHDLTHKRITYSNDWLPGAKELYEIPFYSPRGNVSLYSTVNPPEYIAEGFKFYITKPEALKVKDKALYDIMEEFFKKGVLE